MGAHAWIIRITAGWVEGRDSRRGEEQRALLLPYKGGGGGARGRLRHYTCLSKPPLSEHSSGEKSPQRFFPLSRFSTEATGSARIPEKQEFLFFSPRELRDDSEK